ncbi:hypothetical protein Afil01_24200 [Actinorhabdospora filicis]|uniref:YdhG-like domain-containing protein n=1 Tax=Actinorhabdospora filicis TaxID=1785913 RepID=A0A9W6SJY3_9ACTN|nr:DUF1801 domain-containing protein [Actinorhabdospora filicis]GLZ77613.1 hypothetical protein Afil01_24200 [Actinorhabdospora filicis]
MTTVNDYAATLPAHQREITDILLPIIEAELPGAGALWHGHPVWSLGIKPGQRTVCLVKAYPKNVTFGFFRGQDFTDPSGRLKPGARRMAAVKLTSADEVDAETFTAWLRAARDLEE